MVRVGEHVKQRSRLSGKKPPMRSNMTLWEGNLFCTKAIGM